MDSNQDEGLEPEAKRRRLRKGTHSCWECKRRKVRCSFVSATDNTCITCRRRSTKCISQELPEQPSQIEDRTGRIVRVEALLDQLAKKFHHNVARVGDRSTPGGGQSPRPAGSTPTSDAQSTPFMSLHDPSLESFSRESEDVGAHHLTPAFPTPDSQTPTPARAAPTGASKHERISRALLAACPSRKDIDIVLERSNGSATFCHQFNTKSRSQLDREGLKKEVKLAEISSPHAHPVLLAKQMLILASLLLHFSPYEHIPGLSEHPRVIMERLADTAISLVTTQEELSGSMESLECILLEGFFHLDCANTRRAWLAFRRAMTMGQLMGIHRSYSSPVKVIDPSTDIDPQYMWFRIIYTDRFLSLMLRLPQGHPEESIGPDTTLANGAPGDRIERFHAIISARILERNQLRIAQQALAMTLDIDKELLKAAEALPAKFWAPLNFAGMEKNSQEAFWETMRAKDQQVHYNLLNQLHLPYLLCPSTDPKKQYSKSTCVNASREILTRFIVFRTFNCITSCCRMADFMALVAGMTLILAHIDSHRHEESGNLLAHQRLADRATVNRVLENMEASSKVNEDMLTAKCAGLLQQLLHIEAGADQGLSQDERNVLLVTAPYRGTIKIASEGISFVETPRVLPNQTQDRSGEITIGGIGSVHVSSHMLARESSQPFVNGSSELDDHIDFGNASSTAQQRLIQPASGDFTAVSATTYFPSAFGGEDFMKQQDPYAEITASMNDWVFQGVDTAFFDSLMRGMPLQSEDVGGDADWDPTWHGDLGES